MYTAGGICMQTGGYMYTAGVYKNTVGVYTLLCRFSIHALTIILAEANANLYDNLETYLR